MKDIIESWINGTGATWFLDFGVWMEFRGFWDPAPSDPPGQPPALSQPAQNRWGYTLYSGYEFADPYGREDTYERVYPAGAELATTWREFDGVQLQDGDWSGPGFLFSWHQRPGNNSRVQP